MSQWFRFCRRHLILGVAGGLAMVAFAGQTAKAGQINIVISGIPGGDITVVPAFASLPLDPGGNFVTADVALLNLQLAAQGVDFRFNALGAIANSPASGIDASLFLTGQVYRVTGGGPLSISIAATQNDYSSLATSPGVLTSFSTANFAGAAGGISQVGTSYFASSNVQNDTGGPSTTAPILTPPGGSANETPLSVPQTSVFSLTSRVVITLAGDTTGGLNPPIDQFTHTTMVTSVIPEPASVAMLGMGMPVALVSLVWLRRRRATVGG